jgi:hypothetical protein
MCGVPSHDPDDGQAVQLVVESVRDRLVVDRAQHGRVGVTLRASVERPRIGATVGGAGIAIVAGQALVKFVGGVGAGAIHVDRRLRV